MIVVLIFTVIFAFVGFAGTYYLIKKGKQRSAIDNLIYLEFLINNCQTDHVSRKNIQSMLIEYATKEEYWGDKFNNLNKLFKEKFAKSIEESTQDEYELDNVLSN